MRHFFILMIAAGMLFLFGGCVFNTTGDTEVGVRTVKFGIIAKKGVEEKAYAPGATYFFLPYINDWHTFDTKLQNLEMTFDPERGDRKTRDDLLFKTIDGNDISLDVIIVYRINPEKAPYILQFVAKDDQTLRAKIVRTVARSKPRDIFGELTTEEFYVAENRELQAQRSKEVLQEILGPLGIVIEKVLTKNYRFNEEYQKANVNPASEYFPNCTTNYKSWNNHHYCNAYFPGRIHPPLLENLLAKRLRKSFY